MDECGQMAWGQEEGMGRWEVSDAPGCCWHPEPPLDEKGRRAGDSCGDKLCHLLISSGTSKPALELWTFGLRVG